MVSGDGLVESITGIGRATAVPHCPSCVFLPTTNPRPSVGIDNLTGIVGFLYHPFYDSRLIPCLRMILSRLA